MNENEKMLQEEEMDFITLLDENGNEVDYLVDEEFEFEGKTYLLLCENEESDDALLFYIEESDEDELVLRAVEDDDEFDKVNEYYNSIEFEEE